MAIVTVEHCRRLGYCARGMREFFALHELDWPAFVRGGIQSEALEQTGDDMAIAAVRLAKKDEGGL